MAGYSNSGYHDRYGLLSHFIIYCDPYESAEDLRMRRFYDRVLAMKKYYDSVVLIKERPEPPTWAKDFAFVKTNNMKKFKTPLSITGTTEQLKAVYRLLISIGYTPRLSLSPLDTVISTAWGGIENYFCGDIRPGYGTEIPERISVSASDLPMIKALAAMVEGDEFHPGESVIATSTHYRSLSQGGMYEVISVIPEWVRVRDNLEVVDGFSPSCFRKATVEEIKKHFEPKLKFGQGNFNKIWNDLLLRDYIVCDSSDTPKGKLRIMVGVDFIKEVHAASQGALKIKIEEKFPNLFLERFRIGDKITDQRINVDRKIVGGHGNLFITTTDGVITETLTSNRVFLESEFTKKDYPILRYFKKA